MRDATVDDAAVCVAKADHDAVFPLGELAGREGHLPAVVDLADLPGFGVDDVEGLRDVGVVGVALGQQNTAEAGGRAGGAAGFDDDGAAGIRRGIP